jgi:hypothetical protein
MKIKTAKKLNCNLEQALAQSPNNLYIGNNMKGHSVLLVEVRDVTGRAIPVKIPKTWVPLDLMLFADRESIKKSESIRKLQRRGVICFLDPETSNQIMSTKEAQEEARRIGISGIFKQDISSTADVVNEEDAVPSNGMEEYEYYHNLASTILEMTDEDEIIKNVKDMKSSYFADPEAVDKGKLLLLLQEVKTFCGGKTMAQAEKEVSEMIDSVNE